MFRDAVPHAARPTRHAVAGRPTPRRHLSRAPHSARRGRTNGVKRGVGIDARSIPASPRAGVRPNRSHPSVNIWPGSSRTGGCGANTPQRGMFPSDARSPSGGCRHVWSARARTAFSARPGVARGPESIVDMMRKTCARLSIARHFTRSSAMCAALHPARPREQPSGIGPRAGLDRQSNIGHRFTSSERCQTPVQDRAQSVTV